MNLLLQRQWFTDQSTCGELSIDSDPRIYFTLEPAKPRCIPQGMYKVIIVPSPRLHYITPRLLGVSGWPNDDILIHILNTPEETEGCIGVGLTRETDFIGSSREAFGLLMARVQPPAAAGDLTITVVG